MSGGAACRVGSGVPGLDEILGGGFLPEHTCLVRGGPGTGKTTLALHFLAAGAAAGEPVLYVSLEEREDRLRTHAARCGIELHAAHFLDLSPTSEYFRAVETYDIFSAAEVERTPLTQRIVQEVERLRPQRVVVDPMTQFRYLTRDLFQFRRQVLSFLYFLTSAGATVLFTSESSPEAPDDDLQFLSDAIILLEHGPAGRFLSVTKMRGSGYRAGRHGLRLDERGLAVFPRLIPAEHGVEFTRDMLPSGIAELDQMLHGGLERGTVTIITGPSGVGKSTLAMHFVASATSRGQRCVIYSFEEEPGIVLERGRTLGLPVEQAVESGTLQILLVEPLRYLAEEFAAMVRQAVERDGARLVMLDSVSGYRLALGGEDLLEHLHALAKYLSRMGVSVLLVNETERITGEFQATEAGLSYLADNLIFLRYVEMHGELRRAVGVLKKRLGPCEHALREFSIGNTGIRVGNPLREVRGVLRGIAL